MNTLPQYFSKVSLEELMPSDQESLQSDVKRLASKIDSFSQDACNILAEQRSNNAVSVSSIGIVSRRLFFAVAILGLLLNGGLVGIGATNTQLIICNLGISIIYVLVCMCVVSDLARGKSHFQNERERIQRRMQDVTEQLRALIKERQQWTSEVSQIKASSDTEKIKLQMVKQDLDAQQEKLELTGALIVERNRQLERLECEHSEISNELRLTNSQKEARAFELAQLQDEIPRLSLLARESQSKLYEAESQINSLDEQAIEKSAALLAIEQGIALCLAEKDRVCFERDSAREIDQENGRKRQEELAEENLRISVRFDDAEAEFAELVKKTQSLQADFAALQGRMGLTQERNVELVNQAVTLEANASRNYEAIALSEAELRKLEDTLRSTEARLRSLRVEGDEVELHVATLLTRLGQLECLACASNIEAESKRSSLDALVAALDQREAAMQISMDDSNKLIRDAEKSVVDAERRVEMLTEKADGLAEQVQHRSSELYAHKQELMAIRNEAKELEAAKGKAIVAEEELAALELRTSQQEAEFAALVGRMTAFDHEHTRKIQAEIEVDQRIADLVEILTQAQADVHLQRLEMERLQDIQTQLFQQNSALELQMAGLIEDQQVVTAEIQVLEAAKAQTTLITLELEAVKLELDQKQAELHGLIGKTARFEREYSAKLEEGVAAEHQLSEMTTSLSEARRDLQIQRVELERLQSSRMETEGQISELDHQKGQLLVNRTTILSEVRELQVQIESQKRELLALLGEKSHKDDEIDGLKLRVRELHDHVQTKQLELEQLSGLDRERSDLESQIEDAAGVLAQLESKIRAATAESESQQSMAEIANERLRDLTRDLAAIEHRVDESLASQGIAESKLADLLEQQHAVSEKYAAVTQESRDTERRLLDFTNRSSQLESQCDEASRKLTHLADEVADAQAVAQQWTAYLTTLQIETKASQASKEELENLLEQLQRQEQRIAGEMQAAQAALDSTRLECRDLQDGTKGAERTLRIAQEELEATMRERDQLVDLRYAANQGLEGLRIQIADAEAQHRMALELGAAEYAKVRSSEETRTDLDSKIESMNSEFEAGRQRLSELHAEKDTLQRTNQTLSESVEQARREINSLEAVKANLQQLEDICSERRETLMMIDSELKERTMQRQTLEGEIGGLETKQAELRQLELVCEDSQSTLRKLVAEVDEKTVLAQQLESEIASLKWSQENLSQLKSDCFTQESVLRTMNEVSETRRSQILSLDQTIETKRQQASDLELRLHRDADRLQELSIQTDSQRCESEELGLQVELTRKEIGKLSVRRKSIEGSLADLMQKMDEMTSVLLVCQREVKDTQSTKGELSLGISAIKSQMESLTRSREEVSNELSRVSAELDAKLKDLQLVEAKVAIFEQQAAEQIAVVESSGLVPTEPSRESLEAGILSSLSQLSLIGNESREEMRDLPEPLESTPEGSSLPSMPAKRALKRDAWDSVFATVPSGQS